MAASDRLTSRFAPFWVLILALLSFWVGLTDLPVQDRDEARYAQASRQMAETGDWIDIRFQDTARHVKPVAVYWMQAAVLELTGQTGTTAIWVQRIPSYLAGAFATLALIWAGTPLVGRRAAVLAGVMLASVYMLSAEARTAKTDATLLLTIILAMGAMARAWLGQARGWGVPAVFWTAIAAGLLVKGPVILMPVLGAALWVSIYARRISWIGSLRPLPGLAWMLLLTLPWFIAIMVRTDGAFLMASIGGDLAEKIAATGEHSGIPPGFYILTVWATLWPWSLLLPLAAATGWAMRRLPEGAFILGWIVPTWLVFEAVSTKLIHYTLPTFPALFLLAAVPLVKLIDREQEFKGWSAHLGTVGFAVGTLVFAALVIVMPTQFSTDGLQPVAVAGAITLTLAAIVGCVAYYKGRAVLGTASLTLAGVAAAWALATTSLPGAREFWVTPRLAEAQATLSCLQSPPAFVGHTPPSVVFQFGTDTPFFNYEDAMVWLADAPNRAAWISLSALPEGATAPPGVVDLSEIVGTDYTNGRSVRLRLFVSPGIPAPDTPCG